MLKPCFSAIQPPPNADSIGNNGAPTVLSQPTVDTHHAIAPTTQPSTPPPPTADTHHATPTPAPVVDNNVVVPAVQKNVTTVTLPQNAPEAGQTIGDTTAGTAALETVSAQMTIPYMYATNDEGHGVGLIVDIDTIFFPHAGDYCNATTDSTHYRESIFAEHQLKPTHTESVPRMVDTSMLWLNLAVIVLGLLTTLYYRINHLHTHEPVASIFNQRVMDTTMRDRNLTHRFHQILPILMASSTLSVYGYAWCIALKIPLPQIIPIAMVLIGAIAISLTLFLRSYVIKLLGNVFDNPAATKRYLSIGHMEYLVLSTLMPPIMLVLFSLAPITPAWMIVAGVPVATLYVVNLITALQPFFQQPQRLNMFLIYYLCSIEIIPPLVLTKAFISL